MTQVTEIAPDLFRISTFVPEADLQFNQFVVRDDEPLLFHTGLRKMFPLVRDAVATVIDPTRVRWITFSHFEADECGALNEWLALAPRAQAACGVVGAVVSVDDVADRPARTLADGEVIATGRHRFRYCRTPHVPHGWDAGLLFEETERTLFCSDLLQQNGDVEPLTRADVVGRFRAALLNYQAGPFANYLPWTPMTDGILANLAGLGPKTLATMHGSTFVGDGARALRDCAAVFRDVLGGRNHGA
jgi:flavorubredoxin